MLIFKASGVFNFAQGAMVLLAGLALVRSLDFLVATRLSRPGRRSCSGCCLPASSWRITAWLIERFVLGPLVNQDGLTLFMSTIGATFILEGAAQMIFGSDVYPLRLFPTDAWFLFESVFPGGILVNKLDVWGGLIAGVLVAGLAVFFQNTKTGRALRAVADDHAAAQSVGIPISWIWFVVWLVAGLVALVAATVWGTKLGVQFSITFLALKALPVLIIGGFTSVPGAIVGGLIVGAGEKLAEVFLGPHIGGGIEYWFAYVLALAVLLVRPQGLFGERIIERDLRRSLTRALSRSRPVQDELCRRHGDVPDPPGSHRARPAAGLRLRRRAPARPPSTSGRSAPTTCCAPSCSRS